MTGRGLATKGAIYKLLGHLSLSEIVANRYFKGFHEVAALAEM